MKKFRFKLEPVLRHRSHIEQVKKKELADVNRELLDAQKKLSSFEKEFRNTQVSIEREESIKTLNMENILMFEAYLIHLKRMIELQHILIEQIELKLQKKRLEYVEALKAKKVIEKLREKKYVAYMQEMDKLEQKQIDDMAVTKYVRQHKEQYVPLET